MRSFLGAGALLVGLTLAAAAQEGPVTIKLKKAGQGDFVRESKTEAGTNKMTISMNGMDMKKDEVGKSEFVFVDEILVKAVGSKKPTKVKRTYEKASVEKDGAQVELGLEGKTLMIEQKDGKYEFAFADGKPVSDEAAALLGKEFSNRKKDTDEVFLPKKPVKVGDSWTVDVGSLAEELGESLGVDVAKSKATGKLLKLYPKNSKQYGAFEVVAELAITQIKGNQVIPLDAGSKLTITVLMDGCLDGTETFGGGKMNLQGKLSGEIMGVGLKMDIEQKLDTTIVEVAKKK